MLAPAATVRLLPAMSTTVTIPAQRGRNYKLRLDADHVHLGRTSNAGRVNSVSFTRRDAIAVCNAIVDLLEEQT
ncbi:hypothetical protein MycrhDRAFT_4125 [Mycolicibacterium rhodesiae JS60]|nr:hypothetical protein MycrhDRAFT_4125 [Mycolicibacterium rhodesiae JS60]